MPARSPGEACSADTTIKPQKREENGGRGEWRVQPGLANASVSDPKAALLSADAVRDFI